MRTIGLLMVVLGLVLAVVFLIIGLCFQVPFSTSSGVLFGFGVAYAGLCGARTARLPQAMPH